MSRTPNWLLDGVLTAAHWTWRNRYLVAMLAATAVLIGVMVWRTL